MQPSLPSALPALTSVPPPPAPIAPVVAAACPSPLACATPQPWLGTLVWAVWAVALVGPLLAWMLATAAVGGGARPRSGRGAATLAVATVWTAAVLALVHAGTKLVAELAEGPLAWLDALGLTRAASVDAAGCCVPARGTPFEAAAVLAALAGYLLALVALVVAARRRGETITHGHGLPLGETASWGLFVAAVLAVVGLAAPLTQVDRSIALLDVIGFVPVACVALGLWLRARYEPEGPARAASPELPAAAPALVDVPAVWKQSGALAPDARPLFATPGVAASPGAHVGATFWRLAGALGPPPGAFDEGARLMQGPFQAQLVGDLPDVTERAFLCATILRAALLEGTPTLVIIDDAERDVDGTSRSALRDAVDAAVQASGMWSCGPLVVGERELREALAGRRFPAVAFLGLAELSSHGIRTLGGEGQLWGRNVGLVVVARIDRGTGLEATHRMHILRRLGLALRAVGARWSVLATGFGGVASRSLLEQTFAGFAVRDVHFGPRASAAVQVWTAREEFVHAPGAPWLRRASEPLARGGLVVSVGDPLGTLDQRAVDLERVWLRRDVALGGDASVSHLDDTWMLAGFRSLPHRLPTASSLPHHALWGLTPDPVARFLLRSGTLAQLAQEGRVPAPLPLVGYGNRLVARAHLQAALREAEQDLDSLSGLFGRALVEQVVGEDYRPERFAVRSVPSQQGLRRVPLAPVLAGELASPLRATVTESVVRVVHRHGGRLLLEVDRMVAETRYYPGRVFALGAERFEVPLHAFDAKRAEIQVEAVDAARPVTAPLLALTVSDVVTVEAAHDVRSGALSYALASFEVTAHEQVSGVREVSGRVTTYQPVSAQYRTRMRGIFFPTTPDERVLRHLAASLKGVLLAHLLAADDDLEVVPLRRGTAASLGDGVGVVDRHVQGMGAGEALDAAAVEAVLGWVRGVLSSCRCAQGCAECTPPEALAAGPDKAGVLRLLGA